jgi:hypothetical protein
MDSPQPPTATLETYTRPIFPSWKDTKAPR